MIRRRMAAPRAAREKVSARLLLLPPVCTKGTMQDQASAQFALVLHRVAALQLRIFLIQVTCLYDLE